jgi:hypothetical protein
VAKHHGKRWQKLTRRRAILIRRRLREFPKMEPTHLGRAVVLGYIRQHTGSTFDWRKYMVPETLFKESKCIQYLEREQQHRDQMRGQREQEKRIQRLKAEEPPPPEWLTKFMPTLEGKK